MEGNHTGIRQHLKEMIERGVEAGDILQQGMISAMEIIGEKFKAGDVFIPEVLLSARAMNEGVAFLDPYLATGERGAKGRILFGTVQGDYHDIGKNIVINMLRGVGFEVRDMGINVPLKTILTQIEEYYPDILGLSALLTTTLPEMKRVIDALEASHLKDKVRVMIGGAPVNQNFAKNIGADGFGQDAGEAVKVARQLMKDRSHSLS